MRIFNHTGTLPEQWMQTLIDKTLQSVVRDWLLKYLFHLVHYNDILGGHEYHKLCFHLEKINPAKKYYNLKTA